MLIWKLAGASLMVLAGWMAGSRASGRFDRHIKVLRSFQSAAHSLSAGLRAKQELPEILRSMKEQGEIGAMLAEAGRAMNHQTEPDMLFWRSRLEKTAELDEEDIRQLSSWLGRLFGGDRSLREAQIAEIHQYLTQKLERVQQEKNGCSRLYRNLGVLLALSAAIMLA